MNSLVTRGLGAAVLALASWGGPVFAEQEQTVDVVHFWVSESEGKALDVFRSAWEASGNKWADIPTENKVAVQRIIADRIADGYPPAVMQWNANEGARELPELGVVLDIDAVAQEDHWRDVLPPAVLDRITYQGKVYFAPTNIHAENWLWTSGKVFRELGLEVPSTWDEIFEAAEKAKKTGIVPIALGGGKWEISLLFNNIMYAKMGAEGYARIISGDTDAVLDPRLADALVALRRMSRYAEPLSARKGKTWNDATAMVGRGEAAMQFMGDWAKGEMRALGYKVDQDFGCALVPGTAIAYFMVIDAFAFPITNRNGAVEAQRDFARMVLDRSNQLAFSRRKGSLPARTDVDPSGLDRCGQLGLRMIMENSNVSAQSMAMPSQMSEGWIGILAAFFDDQTISVQDAQLQLHRIVKQR